MNESGYSKLQFTIIALNIFLGGISVNHGLIKTSLLYLI